MDILQGMGVFDGIAIGRLYFFKQTNQETEPVQTDDPEGEIQRYEKAKELAQAQLKELYDQALQEVGEEDAAIFGMHQIMLADVDYCAMVKNIIRKRQVCAQFAVKATMEHFIHLFSQVSDGYLRARAEDVRDVSERLIGILTDTKQKILQVSEPVIVAARDLTPSETIQLDRHSVLGFVTVQGSSHSHTAILARTMNLPAAVGVKGLLRAEYENRLAALDGFTGTLYINPDENTLFRLRRMQQAHLEQMNLLRRLRGRDNVTGDGQRIDIYANIDSVSDVDAVLENDAGGIGLLRSEFLYLEKNDYPDEERQFCAYREVLKRMNGKRVIIRTLDIGADKRVDYFGLPQEKNPAMGYRAIRICMDRPELFRTQLRALYRASVYGKLAILFPMIISRQEVFRLKQITEGIKAELRLEGKPYDPGVEFGIMIETPSAAVISDELAKEVDFFSIGTNDLTQYTLAIDRQNDKLANLYNPRHKSVLRLIQLVAANAQRRGVRVGICGEMAADLSLTELFLAMGIDELSVAPPYVLPLRQKVITSVPAAQRQKQLIQLLTDDD